MFKEKNAQRHNAGQLMELPQDESPAQTNRQRGTPLQGELNKFSELCEKNLIACNNTENYSALTRKYKTGLLECGGLTRFPSDRFTRCCESECLRQRLGHPGQPFVK
jgi:hypothetical protein